jgi:hypothetical protein
MKCHVSIAEMCPVHINLPGEIREQQLICCLLVLIHTSAMRKLWIHPTEIKAPTVLS